MKTLFFRTGFACICVIHLSGMAAAQVSEVRIGIGEFAEDILNPGTEVDNGVEQSMALQGEIIFKEPKALKWALTPQPYINATFNLEGNTNHIGAGLMWRQNFGKKFYGDFAFGLSVHDGTIAIDAGDFFNSDFTAFDGVALSNALSTQREFGSRVLFREQLTLGMRIDETWSTEIFFEHLSNGTVLGPKPDKTRFFDFHENDAADTLGVRVSKRF